MEEYNNLGYNTDFTHGYNLTAPPDWSMEAYRSSHHKNPNFIWNAGDYDTWAEGMQNTYNAYKQWYDTNYNEWYNSEAQQLARKTAIGQNPYYTETLNGSNQAVDGQGTSHSPTNSFDPISMMLNNGLNIAKGVNEIQDSVANRNLTRAQAQMNKQNAFRTYLQNVREAWRMGLGKQGIADENGGTSLGSGTWFDKGSYFQDIFADLDSGIDVMMGTGAGLSTEAGFQDAFGNWHDSNDIVRTPAMMNEEYELGLLYGNYGASKYRLENLMPLQEALMQKENLLSGLDVEQSTKLNTLFDKYVNLIEKGYDFNSKRLEIDLHTLGLDKTLDEVSKILGAVQTYHEITSPRTSSRSVNFNNNITRGW